MSARVASRPKFFVVRETPIPAFLIEGALDQLADQIRETMDVPEMDLPAGTALGWFNTVPDGMSMVAFVRAQATGYLERTRPTENAKTLSNLIDEKDLAIDSALDTVDIEHARARLKGFKQLQEDWDGEGAFAPKEEVIDGAITFLSGLQPWHPRPVAGLDSAGNPVIEFHDDDSRLFGRVRFSSPNAVEMFVVHGDSGTEYLEGSLDEEQVVGFLSDQLQITLRP